MNYFMSISSNDNNELESTTISSKLADKHVWLRRKDSGFFFSTPLKVYTIAFSNHYKT